MTSQGGIPYLSLARDLREAKLKLEKELSELEALERLLKERQRQFFKLYYELRDAADSITERFRFYRVHQEVDEHIYCAARFIMRVYEELFNFPLYYAVEEMRRAVIEIEELVPRLEKEYERVCEERRKAAQHAA
jgi:predicted Zn-dependent protease